MIYIGIENQVFFASSKINTVSQILGVGKYVCTAGRELSLLYIDTTSLFNVGQMHCMTLTPDTEMHIHMRVYVNIVNQPLGTGKQAGSCHN